MIILLLIINVYFILTCPYTKVEESFNMQAVHDILNYQFNVSKFDHLAFPGVVPRTFTIPFIISIFSFPLKLISDILNLPKFYQQLISRFIILCFSLLAQNFFANSIKKTFGNSVKFYYLICTLTQFHINFYGSRSLPNNFALIIALFSISFYLRRKFKCFVILSGVAILLIRSELMILFGLMLLFLLIGKKFSITKFFITSFFTALILLGISIAFDSYFWQRIVWPEAEVLVFNTILNRSSEWGTLPFFWYFYSALPRCLLASTLPSILNCVVNSKAKSTELMLYGLGFVFIYSFLPHKELRFVIYVVPILNTAAAHFWQFVYEKSEKSKPFRLLNKFLWLLAILNIIMTIFLLKVSHYNYPGGEAISKFNSLAHLENKDVHVHFCNLAAQTGVTRFIEQHENWTYNKTERIDYHPAEMATFTHVILETPRKTEFETMMKSRDISYRLLFNVDSYNGLSSSWPFYKLRSSLVVLERLEG